MPNAISYTCCMDACARDEPPRWQLVLELLSELEAAEVAGLCELDGTPIKPTVIVYSAAAGSLPGYFSYTISIGYSCSSDPVESSSALAVVLAVVSTVVFSSVLKAVYRM
jgi:hypothetical protein